MVLGEWKGCVFLSWEERGCLGEEMHVVGSHFHGGGQEARS